MVPVFQVMHSMPTKSKPLSVLGRINDGEVVRYRYYDEDGYVEKDIDLTDHGNPKEHPEVPHAHRWKRRYNAKRGKIILNRSKWKSDSRNELDDIERWRKEYEKLQKFKSI